MKRMIQNIIFIILIILVGVTMFFTMNYAKNSVSYNQNSQNDMNKMFSNMNKDKESGGESNEKSPEMSSENNEVSNQPPAIPDGENNSNNGESPEILSDENNSDGLGIIYYVLFGVESFILSGLIIYLLMSGFNAKTIKETFFNKDKIVIGVLSIIILTSGITFVDGFIAKNYFLDNSNAQTSGNGKPNESQNSEITYSAAKEIKEDTSIISGEYSSTNKDENAILVSGDIDATLSNIEVTKTGDSDGGDNTSFYGTNSAIIASDGANLILKNITVNTDATGANGVFSYGGSATTNNSSSDNTMVTISNSKITTIKDNSGGIMTTGGGIMKAFNLTINTAGISSAAIRTDRGGGIVTVDGGTYTTTGQGSPVVYSTADITVSDAKLISKASEGIIIEGKNSVTINNCDLTDNNTKLNGQSTTYKNIFLYQSMSGDAEDGNAEFSAIDSTITTNNGDSFYVTNTIATIKLKNNKIVNNDLNANFLRIQKDSWGKTGANGGNVTLIMTEQNVMGNIVVDSISTLDMTMNSNSYFEGIINGDNSAKTINLTLDKTSKIKLTGDSYVTKLNNSDTSNSNIDYNGYKLYVNGKAIN